jgi:transcriptional regulator with XRE-family HTH domain
MPPNRVAIQFGENLRLLRRAAGISQEELGLRSSLHRTEIGLLERGARTPRIDTLIKVASALEVRIECALLDGINWAPGSTQAGAFRLAPNRQADLTQRQVHSRHTDT